jgi:hypothetical protein
MNLVKKKKKRRKKTHKVWTIVGNSPITLFLVCLHTKMTKSTLYIKEYRILLEKLIESKVRIAECAQLSSNEKHKLDTLIDKLISYFNKSLDKSLIIVDKNYNDKDEEI